MVLIQDSVPALIRQVQETVNFCKKSSQSAVDSREDSRRRYNYGLVLLSIMNCSLFQELFFNTLYLDQLFSMMDGLETDVSHSSFQDSAKNTLMQIYEKPHVRCRGEAAAKSLRSMPKSEMKAAARA